jgi:small subunit ribosomal protein S15
MVQKNNREDIMNDIKKHAQDTGSIEVQVASLTEDIQRLTEHFKEFPKDFNSKRGLMKKVSRRKSFLSYLKRKDEQSYQKLVNKLGIR